MSVEQLEQRMATIEQEVAELRKEVAAVAPGPKKRGVLSVVGSMADFPEFEDVMENARRRREAELAEFDSDEGRS
jgi:hypothetical protein